jgi:hypothetical protein
MSQTDNPFARIEASERADARRRFANMPSPRKPLVHYAGLFTSAIQRLVNGLGAPEAFAGASADEHQQNGAYGVHQLCMRLPGDPTLYRVLIAPADAPISIGGVPADQHFSYPLGQMPVALGYAGRYPKAADAA